MDEFINTLRANLEIGKHNRFFQMLVPAANAAYRAAIDCVPRDAEPMFGRILLIAHKSMLSAAVLIAELQPEDSVGITRRALEAARLAVAIKLNDQNVGQWMLIKNDTTAGSSASRERFQDLSLPGS